MKFLSKKTNLSSGLATTSHIISSGNTLPILNNILFKTEKGQLKLSATNLEIAINTWVGGKIEEEGQITVPARLVNEYVNNLLSDKITITTKNQDVVLEAENATTHIKGLAAEEFPLIPQIAENLYTKIATTDLHRAVSEVGFATAFSETQPEISGILFNFEGKTLTLAATDRYRLAEAKILLENEIETPRQLIIPAKAVNEITRVLNKGVVGVYLKEGQICFKGENVELVSRLIDGEYPDYKQVVPTDFTTEAVVKRGEFIQSIKAASLFASENNNVELDLNPANKQVVIKAQSSQVGNSEIALTADLTGPKNQIIFNYRYILECLNNLPDDQVALKVISSSSPAQIVPQKRDNYFYVVMPIKI